MLGGLAVSTRGWRRAVGNGGIGKGAPFGAPLLLLTASEASVRTGRAAAVLTAERTHRERRDRQGG